MTANVKSYGHGIVVERDNIIIDGAGHIIEGSGDHYGLELQSRSRVTIQNLTVQNFYSGIYLEKSSNNTIINDILQNNERCGVGLHSSFCNIIINNTIQKNDRGLNLDDNSSNNIICENTIADNNNAMYFYESSNNVIYHNNFLNNEKQVEIISSINIWDNGCPSGGN